MFPTTSRENPRTSSDGENKGNSTNEDSFSPSVARQASPVENTNVVNANNSTFHESNSRSASVPSPTENIQGLSAKNSASNDDSNPSSPFVTSISPDADDDVFVVPSPTSIPAENPNDLNDNNSTLHESNLRSALVASPAENIQGLSANYSASNDDSNPSSPSETSISPDADDDVFVVPSPTSIPAENPNDLNDNNSTLHENNSRSASLASPTENIQDALSANNSASTDDNNPRSSSVTSISPDADDDVFVVSSHAENLNDLNDIISTLYECNSRCASVASPTENLQQALSVNNTASTYDINLRSPSVTSILPDADDDVFVVPSPAENPNGLNDNNSTLHESNSQSASVATPTENIQALSANKSASNDDSNPRRSSVTSISPDADDDVFVVSSHAENLNDLNDIISTLYECNSRCASVASPTENLQQALSVNNTASTYDINLRSPSVTSILPDADDDVFVVPSPAENPNGLNDNNSTLHESNSQSASVATPTENILAFSANKSASNDHSNPRRSSVTSISPDADDDVFVVPSPAPSPAENPNDLNDNNSTLHESNSQSVSVATPTENILALSANNSASNDNSIPRSPSVTSILSDSDDDESVGPSPAFSPVENPNDLNTNNAASNDDSNPKSPSVASISPDSDDDDGSVVSVHSSTSEEEERSRSPFVPVAGPSSMQNAPILIAIESGSDEESSSSEPSAGHSPRFSPVEKAPVLNGNSSSDGDADGDVDDSSSSLSANVPLDMDSDTQTSFEAAKSKRDKNNDLHVGEQTPHTSTQFQLSFVFPAEDSLETARKRLSHNYIPKVRNIPLPSLTWSNNWNLIERLFSEENMSLDKRDPFIFRRNPNLITRMRAILFDWLIEVSDVFKLRRATYYLAIDYIDRYLSKKPNVKKNELQLIGITCLFLASKVQEIYPPKITELAYVTDGACNDDDMMNKELDILTQLGWDVQPITASEWLALFLQIASTSGDNIRGASSSSTNNKEDIIYPQYSPQTFMQASMILDLCSLDDGMLQFKYSVIVTSILYYVLNREKALFISGFKWYHIRVCTEWVMPFAMVVMRALTKTTLVPRKDKFRKGSGLRVRNPNIILDEGHTIQNHAIDLKLLDEVYKEIKIYREEHKVRKTHATGWNSTTAGFLPSGRRPSLLSILANDKDFSDTRSYHKDPIVISSDSDSDQPKDRITSPRLEGTSRQTVSSKSETEAQTRITSPRLEGTSRQTVSSKSETKTRTRITSPRLEGTFIETVSSESETEDQTRITSPRLEGTSRQTVSSKSETKTRTRITSPRLEGTFIETVSSESETEDETRITSPRLEGTSGETVSSESETEDETRITSPRLEGTSGETVSSESETEDETRITSPRLEGTSGETVSSESETEDETRITSPRLEGTSRETISSESETEDQTRITSPRLEGTTRETVSSKSETETEIDSHQKFIDKYKIMSPILGNIYSPGNIKPGFYRCLPNPLPVAPPRKLRSILKKRYSPPDPSKIGTLRSILKNPVRQTNSLKSETETQRNKQKNQGDSHNNAKTSSSMKDASRHTNSPKSEIERKSNYQKNSTDSHKERKSYSVFKHAARQINSPKSDTETHSNKQKNPTDSHKERKTSPTLKDAERQTNSPRSENERHSNQQKNQTDSHKDRETSPSLKNTGRQTNSPKGETETQSNNQMNQTDSDNKTIEHKHKKSPDTCQNQGVKRRRSEELTEPVEEPPRKMSCHEIEGCCSNMLASPSCSGLYLQEGDKVFFGLRRTNPVSSVLPPQPKEPPVPDQETLEEETAVEIKSDEGDLRYNLVL